MKYRVITIDGGAATGKSSISKIIAKNMQGIYIPTGKLYRLITLFAVKNNLISSDLNIFNFLNIEDIELSNEMFFIKNFTYQESELFSNLVLENIFIISNNKIIRLFCNKVFLNILNLNIDKKIIILEGRDAGTKIFPTAKIKIFLKVSQENAFQRRLLQNKKNNTNISDQNILEDIKKRDKEDFLRKNDPLRIPPNSIIIETDNYTKDELVHKIQNIIKERENG